MKKIFSGLFLGLVFLSTNAYAVELHYATNEQILRELSRRLAAGGGGGGGVGGAAANYTCSNVGYLTLELIGPSTTQNQTLFTGSYSNCEEQARELNIHKAKIFSVTMAAACSSVGYLNKYPLRPDGTFGTLSTVFVGDYTNCLNEAKVINQHQ